MLQYSNSSGYLFLRLVWLMAYLVVKHGYFWCIMGALRDSSAPIPHDSLHNLISQISTCIEIKVCSTISISVLFCMRTSSTIYIVYRYEGGLAIWQFLLAATGKAQSFLVHLDQRSM